MSRFKVELIMFNKDNFLIIFSFKLNFCSPKKFFEYFLKSASGVHCIFRGQKNYKPFDRIFVNLFDCKVF